MIEIKILIAYDSIARKARGLVPEKIISIFDTCKIQRLGFLINLAKKYNHNKEGHSKTREKTHIVLTLCLAIYTIHVSRNIQDVFFVLDKNRQQEKTPGPISSHLCLLFHLPQKHPWCQHNGSL
jgi:hypothetical protein